ncbi:MAG: hypothetical protein AB1671_24045, partial [Thermodesulfobacteriota bacterium]
VTVGRSNAVAVIDTATDAVIKMIPVGTTPWGVAVAPAHATAALEPGDGVRAGLQGAMGRLATLSPYEFRRIVLRAISEIIPARSGDPSLTFQCGRRLTVASATNSAST